LSGAGNNAAWKERRQSPRLRCSGSAVFRTEASEVRIWGTVTAISLNGCHAEMNTTFPVGTKVDLVRKSFGVRNRGSGRGSPLVPLPGHGHLLRGNPTRIATAPEGSPHQTGWAQRLPQ
jgi:hypothetical protein